MAESSLTFTFLLLLLARELRSSSTTRVCCSIMSWTVWTLSEWNLRSASLLGGEGPVMLSLLLLLLSPPPPPSTCCSPANRLL